MPDRRIVFVIFPGFQILDLTGRHEVFTQAERLTSAERLTPGYRLETVAATAGPVTASGGLGISPTSTIDACVGPIDTLVVVGGQGRTEACADRRLVAWLGAAAGRSRRRSGRRSSGGTRRGGRRPGGIRSSDPAGPGGGQQSP